ncbi:respiratory nitrate reductase subunit gamma [Geomonas sp. Red69]|uniref:respiratory nitrate reductase subunit gamma n=1 Tax=Geomonas diazotrophica TaxID=2843197 RepID=UPI001C115F40|nr:respiratory nitrate reductase subunit gamma [Geomonas diazotrophica]MBU5636444.1 respiratory nitrate reductase subunit gamma [Geomonas diazotrophica]
MLNSFIFIALPYAALALVLLVTPYRFLSNRLTWSAYSTQFLERNILYWGINPWHYGILPILLAHVVGFAFPGVFKRFLGNPQTLLGVESVLLGLGIFAVLGVLLLLLRRVNSGMLKRVTFSSDWLILYLLLFQAGTGIYIGYFMRWGSQWYLHTAVPYLWSIVSFQPQIEYVADLPLVFKLHAACAFLIVAVLPFTKLVHMLYLPVDFLKDPPLLYRWRSK